MNWRCAISLTMSALLAGCTQSSAPSVPPPAQPVQAVQQVDAVDSSTQTTAVDTTADRASIEADFKAMNDGFRKSIKLADPTRVVDRESARAAAALVDGVSVLTWVGNEKLLAIVSRNDARSVMTINAICSQLEPIGDTQGIVVSVQIAAKSSGQRDVLSRDCQPRNTVSAVIAPDVQAEPMPTVVEPVIPPAVMPATSSTTSSTVASAVPAPKRQSKTADKHSTSAEDAELKRKQQESIRILEDTTPEM